MKYSHLKIPIEWDFNFEGVWTLKNYSPDVKVKIEITIVGVRYDVFVSGDHLFTNIETLEEAQEKAIFQLKEACKDDTN